MKVLLDECVPERLRGHIRGHQIHTARYAGFRGKRNGELLRLAEEAGYAVLVTADQGIPYQHTIAGRTISIIVMRAPGNDIGTLKQMTGAVERALIVIAPGQIIELDWRPLEPQSP